MTRCLYCGAELISKRVCFSHADLPPLDGDLYARLVDPYREMMQTASRGFRPRQLDRPGNRDSGGNGGSVERRRNGHGGVENFDGGLIVPPGGILTLVCGTTPVGHSAASCILWEEVPL